MRRSIGCSVLLRILFFLTIRLDSKTICRESLLPKKIKLMKLQIVLFLKWKSEARLTTAHLHDVELAFVSCRKKGKKCKMREKNSRNRRKANTACSVCSMSFNNFCFLYRFLQFSPQHFSIIEPFSWILLCSLFRFCIVKRFNFYLNKMLIMKLLQV